ncbi:hypothetical protein V6N13_133325 [Hibiscus sabdariffa]
MQWGDVNFFLSDVYASNNRDDRVGLWNDLLEFKGRVRDSPWVIAGDLNIIFRPEESSNFNGSQGEAYGDISNRVQAQQVELERLQACMMSDPTTENVGRGKAANIGLRDMLKAEE